MIRENSVTYLLRELENIISRYNPHFILCVLQSPRADIYNGIKRKLCVDRASKKYKINLKYIVDSVHNCFAVRKSILYEGLECVNGTHIDNMVVKFSKTFHYLFLML